MINPLIVGIGMDETVDAERVTIDHVGRELQRRNLLMEINSHSTEIEVWICVEHHREISYAVASTLTEAMIDALNAAWQEHKR